MFYSAKTQGFYSREIHGDNIPADAVSISDADYNDLLDGQSSGKRIVPDANGRPVLADPPPPSQSDKNAQARAYLAYTDWYVVRFAETGEAIPADIAADRAAARASVI